MALARSAIRATPFTAASSSRPAAVRVARSTLRRPRATPEDSSEDLSGLLKDLERFQAKAPTAGPAAAAGPAAPRPAAAAAPAASSSGSGEAAPANGFKETLDKLLIADFFLVLAILGWFVVGLGLQGALHQSALLDAWFPLWPMVFQPAIGVLMAGALVSGGLGWLKEQDKKKGGA